MNTEDMTALEKISALENTLDRIADSTGRAKAGYIWVMTEILNKLKNDILIMEEQIKDKEEPEISIEPLVEENQNGGEILE